MAESTRRKRSNLDSGQLLLFGAAVIVLVVAALTFAQL
jgi:hypothetical protein